MRVLTDQCVCIVQQARLCPIPILWDYILLGFLKDAAFGALSVLPATRGAPMRGVAPNTVHV